MRLKWYPPSCQKPLKILYLYALPYEELISRYKKYGFKRLGQKYEKEIHSRLKPKYDKYCIFMYRILD